MNDRFKYRVYFKGSEYAKAGYQDLSRKDVIYSLKSDGQIIRNVVYECQQKGHEGSPCNMPFEPNNDLYDIQFCTGLKDKNGKLIYEGDIVSIDDGELKGIAQRHDKFDEYYGCIEIKLICKHTTIYKPTVFAESEVIGNIYVNKELLNNE